MSAIRLVDDPAQLAGALSPIRRRLLAALTEPASATRLAVVLGLSRQKVNYHLRILEQLGLIELAEVRQRRGCTERVLRRTGALVVDPGLVDPGVINAGVTDRAVAGSAPSGPDPNGLGLTGPGLTGPGLTEPAPTDGAAGRVAAADRHAAEHLIATAGRTVSEVTRMQSAAEEQGRRLLTFTVETEVAFGDPADVHRFTDELAGALAAVAGRFHTPGGRRYTVTIGGHPAAAPAPARAGAA